MDTFTIHDLMSLTDSGSPEHCVSLYMPTHVTGPSAQEDSVRLKNLLDRAQAMLANRGMRTADARDCVQRARELPADVTYWNARNRGLALFLTPQSFRRFRLPEPFEELVDVNRRFHIRPLVPLLGSDLRFLLLAMSQHRIRLFEGLRSRMHELKVPRLPENLADELNYETPERASQTHSAGRLGSRKQSAVFHGQGGKPDTAKEELGEYLRAVDAALHPVLRDETVPLLLAAVDHVATMFKTVTTYPHVLDETITGNPDHATEHELHARAWPLIQPLLSGNRDEALEKYRRLSVTAKTTDEIREILPAAFQGRVQSLFLNRTAQSWGSYSNDTQQMELHDQPNSRDEDLLDLASVKTLQGRGAVYALEPKQMPTRNPVAAVLRY